MTEQEFLIKRKPFYIDSDTVLVKFPTSRHMDVSHAQWFTEVGYPYCHVIRGYLMDDIEHPYVMLYWNDYEIPNIATSAFIYLFEYFPQIEYIGLGCHKGQVGEVWKPKLIVKRENV